MSTKNSFETMTESEISTEWSLFLDHIKRSGVYLEDDLMGWWSQYSIAMQGGSTKNFHPETRNFFEFRV